MSQGWRMPDGTPCGRESVYGHQTHSMLSDSGYCYNGQCKPFNCEGEMYTRLVQSSPNVYRGLNQTKLRDDHYDSWSDRCSQSNTSHSNHIDQSDIATDDQYDSSYHLVPKRKNPIQMENSDVTNIATGSKQNHTMTARVLPPYLTIATIQPNWTEWSPVTDCQYSTMCITTGRGFRLMTRQCRTP